MIWVEYVIVDVGIAVAEVPEPEVETVLPLYSPCQLLPPLMVGEVK